MLGIKGYKTIRKDAKHYFNYDPIYVYSSIQFYHKKNNEKL